MTLQPVFWQILRIADFLLVEQEGIAKIIISISYFLAAETISSEPPTTATPLSIEPFFLGSSSIKHLIEYLFFEALFLISLIIILPAAPAPITITFSRSLPYKFLYGFFTAIKTILVKEIKAKVISDINK